MLSFKSLFCYILFKSIKGTVRGIIPENKLRLSIYHRLLTIYVILYYIRYMPVLIMPHYLLFWAVTLLLWLKWLLLDLRYCGKAKIECRRAKLRWRSSGDDSDLMLFEKRRNRVTYLLKTLFSRLLLTKIVTMRASFFKLLQSWERKAIISRI